MTRFWDGYRATLKPLEVEEPIDVWVHRPLAFVVARALFGTPVSPNAVTFASIAAGVGAGAAMVWDYPRHLALAGTAVVSSAVLDCADGQLARMRGTSSAFGRMLDGVADTVVAGVIVAGGAWMVGSKYRSTPWVAAAILGLSLFTIATGSLHTAMYDHYKNVFLRLTHPSYRDGEDYAAALARRAREASRASLIERIAWPVYLFYVKSQHDYVRKFDPHTVSSLDALPRDFDAQRADLYRRHAGPLMRHWRNWFGFGSLVFGMALAIAFDVVEYYVVVRGIALNAFFFGILRPAQRRASRAAFRELGIGSTAR